MRNLVNPFKQCPKQVGAQRERADAPRLARAEVHTAAARSWVTLGVALSTWLIVVAAANLCIAEPAEQKSEQDPEQNSDKSPAEITPGEQLFALKVRPLLAEKCFVCHGKDPEEVGGELNLLSRAGMLKGSETSKSVLVPGKSDQSLLYIATTWKDAAYEMPPKENDRLTEAQTWLIRDWIDAGAPWPSDERIAAIVRAHSASEADGVQVATTGPLSQEWATRRYQPENLWAYQPLHKPAVPANPQAVDPQAVEAHPIDAFLNVGLQSLKLQPAARASRRELLRRATFDLTGLPPTPIEMTEFLQDQASDAEAFAKVVDRLLLSPHYGEQWGRHWLDVVRYADSSGYANDYERGNAWRYRDYVIRAFNDDKPYDQFVREQIAGDELVSNVTQQDVPKLLIASGFLRMGPWELTGMEVARVARQRFLDDVTDAVGQVFLAHMLQCARCHDHKFDPLPTHDYYAMQAAFATTQLAEQPAAFLPVENTTGFEEKKYLEQRRDYYNEILAGLNEKSIAAARAWYVEQEIDSQTFEAALKPNDGKQAGRGRTVGYNEVRNILRRNGVPEAHIPPRHVGFAPQDFGMERVARKGLERLRWRMERYEPIALTVYSGRTPNLKNVNAPLRMPKNRLSAGDLEETCILVGGDPFSPAQPVSPAVLSAVASMNPAIKPPNLPTGIVGRRRALADWIASPHNPLTARVIVNRIWQWHFGRAIAGNPNNFGTTGKKPTHPELLDWLAATLIERGWSMKSMHRLIMLSDAYARSTRHPQADELARQDPADSSYAVFRPRRLDAEELRDAMLLLSGELNLTVGGIPIRPEMNLEAALQPRMVMGTFAEAWQPSPLPEQRHRRSIYALRIRGQRDPFQDVFNAPTPDLSCEAREASTVTPQVFAMFNSEITYDRALAFANRVLRQSRSREESIQQIFERALNRRADAVELAACLAHWERMIDVHAEVDVDVDLTPYPREVVREAVEENTGEKFTFVEPLEVHADFVPDLKPADVDPEVRALADVCLVLLNSNEFAYVY